MPVPDFQSFFRPVLQQLSSGEPKALKQLRESVARTMNLSESDLNEKLASGVQTVFVNRLSWSAVYLTNAGALERTARGVYRITERGHELLSDGDPRLTVRHLSAFPEFVVFHKGTPGSMVVPSDNETDQRSQSPEEQLENAHRVLREALAVEVLEVVMKSAPAFFEEIVIELLVAMGYGGSVEDAGKAVGRSGDGGIDGRIKEDKLGLDVVYVQAKRWKDVVGRPTVQAFAGSLEGVRARKGVLITTSWFSDEAREYVDRIEKKIVLVDGRQLAELMIDHDIGVTLVRTYKVKRLDSDYFESD